MKNIEQDPKIKDLYKLSDIDLLRYFKKNPNSVAFYPLSKRLFTKKKYRESIKILLSGINKHPDFIEPKILLAKLYIKTENTVEAVQSLRETIKFAPNCADSYYYLSEILFKKGINERAEILLTKAYELAPHMPDIKNSFEKRFKNSGNTTTAAYNIESTVIESLDDIKKRAVKELYQDPEKVKKKEQNIKFIKNYDQENILKELEKEFSYKKKQIFVSLFGIFILLTIIAYLIISIFYKGDLREKQKNKAQLVSMLNNNIANIKKENSKHFPDINLYYEVLYHYQVDHTQYKDSIKQLKAIKSFDSIWKLLAKMTHLLYQNKTSEFNAIYEQAKIKFNDIPDIFLLKGYQLLGQGDYLNCLSLFDLAYKKSKGANRFKIELASLYYMRHSINKISTLDIKPNSQETILFYEILRKKGIKEQEKVLLENLSSTQNNIQKEKIAIFLINNYIKQKKIEKAEEIYKQELSKNHIPYYAEYYKHIGDKIKKFKR